MPALRSSSLNTDIEDAFKSIIVAASPGTSVHSALSNEEHDLPHVTVNVGVGDEALPGSCQFNVVVGVMCLTKIGKKGSVGALANHRSFCDAVGKVVNEETLCSDLSTAVGTPALTRFVLKDKGILRPEVDDEHGCWVSGWSLSMIAAATAE